MRGFKNTHRRYNRLDKRNRASGEKAVGAVSSASEAELFRASPEEGYKLQQERMGQLEMHMLGERPR